ncbi:MAG TPA: response regulator transcription factor [Candidatus Dormibacteraeota bacterium]|nr:response regulator transcription factor [Candidatus Dormibacteraeota bacterium]
MRILIADDHHMVRRGVGDLLSKEAGWEICGEATDAAQAIQKASELNPDLVLLDISLPDGSGLEAARRIRQEIPHVRILMMSHHDATQFVQSALESGADGCIDKARLALDLVAMIKSLQPRNSNLASAS